MRARENRSANIDFPDSANTNESPSGSGPLFGLRIVLHWRSMSGLNTSGVSQQRISRREVLKLSSLGAVAAAFPRLRSSAFPATQPAARDFQFRLLLGWINDNSNRPLTGSRWPITAIDEQTVKDYAVFLRTAREYGYNGVTLWGLYASHAWAVPLRKSIDPARRRLVDQILNEAQKQRVKVLYGLGVYSWGFEEIIKQDPSTARNEGRMVWGKFQPDNGVAMCYHSESARRWMRSIVDLCVNEVGTQGFGFQSADLGRCYCHECRHLSDVEYHSRVINETAEYIRQQHPGQTLGMSAWGVDLGCGAEALKEMTSHLDFLTDVTDQSARKGREYRRSLTAGLPCALGSLGGAVITPPQRWARDRWFLPHAELTGKAIQSLHADGGRAFEFFMGPLANPQFNLMTRYVGLLLSKPDQSCEQALAQVVEDLYEPRGKAAVGDIVGWLFAVEQAYMSRVGDISGGEFDFEPLAGETAGEPIYLTRLSREALAGYGNDLGRLSRQLPALAAQCRRPQELQTVARCLDNVQRDVQRIQRTPATGPA